MQVLNTILFAVQILSALAMIGLILVQHGKGADMGAAFGSGSSGSLFGASGSANLFVALHSSFSDRFFVSTLGLAYTSGVRPAGSGSVLDKAPVTAPSSSPAGVTAPRGFRCAGNSDCAECSLYCACPISTCCSSSFWR
ncbi:MAG: preprotein translocase subunit SecG [Brachymonas sp.]|nr:preprotein translocase subunit SecG [Brachymonas sp.]